MKERPAAGINFKQLGPNPPYKPLMPRSLAMPLNASNVLVYTTRPLIAPTCNISSKPQLAVSNKFYKPVHKGK